MQPFYQISLASGICAEMQACQWQSCIKGEAAVLEHLQEKAGDFSTCQHAGGVSWGVCGITSITSHYLGSRWHTYNKQSVRSP